MVVVAASYQCKGRNGELQEFLHHSFLVFRVKIGYLESSGTLAEEDAERYGARKFPDSEYIPFWCWNRMLIGEELLRGKSVA